MNERMNEQYRGVAKKGNNGCSEAVSSLFRVYTFVKEKQTGGFQALKYLSMQGYF